MSVDMFPIRFLAEIDRLPEFQMRGRKDMKVHKHGIPAWKAPFMEAVAACHSSYTLPTYDMFMERMITCLFENNKHDPRQYADTFRQHHAPVILNEDFEPNAGFLYRVSELYEGGIAELYAYVMLVFAFEDRIGNGLIMNDMRVDWKLKLDTVVMCNGKVAGIDMHFDPDASRHDIQIARRQREMASKRHIPIRDWNNEAVKGMPKFTLIRDDQNCLVRNGYRLFSDEAIDALLGELYEYFEIPEKKRVYHEILHQWPRRRS